MLSPSQIKYGNDLILNWLGYIYKYPAYEDFSDIGGLYTFCTYHSRVPLQFEFQYTKEKDPDESENMWGRFSEKITDTHDYILVCDNDKPHYDFNYDTMQLKYHSSWEYLMPVIEKIESLGTHYTDQKFKVFGKEHQFRIWSALHEPEEILVIAETKISAAYQAVIKFIEWQNKFGAERLPESGRQTETSPPVSGNNSNDNQTNKN